MPPLVAQAFWPLITHSSLASSYLAVVRIAETSEPGVGLGRAEGGDLGIVGGAEALRDPLAELLGGAVAEDRGDGERRADDRHPDPGVAPEELLVDDRQGEPGGIGPELRQRPRTRRGRSWRPPGSRARASPRARPTRRRRAARRPRRIRGPTRGCPSGPARAPSRSADSAQPPPVASATCCSIVSAALIVVSAPRRSCGLGGLRDAEVGRHLARRTSGRPRSSACRHEQHRAGLGAGDEAQEGRRRDLEGDSRARPPARR